MYAYLQINDYRNTTRRTPKIHNFWVNLDDAELIASLSQIINLGNRRRRRSKRHHKNREYLDKHRGNIFIKRGYVSLPKYATLSELQDIESVLLLNN